MSPAVTRCPQCKWSIEVPDRHEAFRAINLHFDLRHAPRPATTAPAVPVAPEPVQQLATADWELQALDALVLLATDKAEFTLFEITDYGVGEPLNPRNDWGGLARTGEHLELIVQAQHADGSQKFTRSLRPASKSSAVAVWTAGPGIARHRGNRRATA